MAAVIEPGLTNSEESAVIFQYLFGLKAKFLYEDVGKYISEAGINLHLECVKVFMLKIALQAEDSPQPQFSRIPFRAIA